MCSDLAIITVSVPSSRIFIDVLCSSDGSSPCSVREEKKGEEKMREQKKTVRYLERKRDVRACTHGWLWARGLVPDIVIIRCTRMSYAPLEGLT